MEVGGSGSLLCCFVVTGIITMVARQKTVESEVRGCHLAQKTQRGS